MNYIKTKKQRVDKQYYVDLNSSKEETKKAIDLAQEFNSLLLEKIDLIKNQEITTLRNKLNKYFS
jgi:hypothetical protein